MLASNLGTDDVTSNILLAYNLKSFLQVGLNIAQASQTYTRSAKTVSVESSSWLNTAALQSTTKNILRKSGRCCLSKFFLYRSTESQPNNSVALARNMRK